MSFCCLDLVNVPEHSAYLLLKSFPGAEHRLSGCHLSTLVLILEVVLEEGFDLTKGLPSKVGCSLQSITFVSRELIIVEVRVEFYL